MEYWCVLNSLIKKLVWIVVVAITLGIGPEKNATAKAGLPEFTTSEALQIKADNQTESIRNGGSQWPVVETEFFIIHHQANLAPDMVACQKLDSFVRYVLKKIQPDHSLELFRKQKMAYYFCDDATVEKLTGYPTRGMADMTGNAIISSHFPHFHELAHLLVYNSMTNKPAQTLPVVQEGLACLLGGRWGRSSQAILYTGWVHHSFDMGQWEDVLTQDDFYTFSGGADITYPLGAMICELVRREAGWAAVRELNERMSGSVEYVSSLTAMDVASVVADVCGWPSADAVVTINKTMENIWPEYRRCGVAPIKEMPLGHGRIVESEIEASAEIWKRIVAGKLSPAVLEQNGTYIRVVASEFPVYLLSKKNPHKRAASSLFLEHLPSEKYEGQRYGLRCDPGNIALYDFASNELVATWVASFTDEDAACGTSIDGLFFQLDDCGSPAQARKAIRWATVVKP